MFELKPFPRTRAFLGDFRQSEEGRLFLFGLLFALMFFVLLFIGAIYLSDGLRLLDMFVYQVLAGRMAGLAKGTQLGVPRALIFSQVLAVELLLTYFFYPLAIYSTYQITRIPFLARGLDRTLAAAEEYRPQLRRWGVPGLIVFIAAPVYLTGPLVGAVIARLMGFSHRASLLTATAGTVLSVSLWFSVVRPVLSRAGDSTYLIPLGIVVAVLAWLLYRFLRKRRRKVVSMDD